MPQKVKACENPELLESDAPRKMAKTEAIEASTDYAKIVRALAEYEQYPASARQMFIEGLPYAVVTCESQRHAYQVEIVDSVRSVLSDARGCAADAQAACEQRTREAAEERRLCEEAREGAVLAEATASAEREAKATALLAMQQEVGEAELENTQAKRSKERASKASTELEEEKARLTCLIDGPLLMLTEGGWEDEEVRNASIEAVNAYLTDITAEEVLISAASSALTRRPAERGTFDKLTVDSLNEVFSGKLKDLRDSIAAATERREEATAEALGAWAWLDVAEERVDEAQHALTEAEASREDAISRQKSEEVKATDMDGVVQKLTLEQTFAEEKVKEFDRALASFEQLIKSAEIKVNEAPLLGA